jgi:hypothetical protein
MNEPERFFQSIFARVERIETMSETQVVNGLRAVKAMRDSRGKTLAFLTACSLVPAEDSEDEINKLRSELSSAAHPDDSASRLSDYIEDALKKRLETLRKTGK